MVVVVLPELDGQPFTSDEAFKGSGNAQAFVEPWRAAAKGIMMLPANRDDPTTQQPQFLRHREFTLSTRAHSSGRVELYYTSHYIPEMNPSSLQRCARDSNLLAFVKQASPKVRFSSRMAILWVEHDLLSKETRETVREGCKVSGNITLLNRMRSRSGRKG